MSSRISISQVSPGAKFGQLTVVEPAQKQGPRGGRYWHCRCNCGGEITLQAHRMQRSCGCKSTGAGKFKELNLVDREFGALLVLSHSKPNWCLCQCRCGNQIELPSYKLVQRQRRSCGCMRSTETRTLNSAGYATVYAPEHPRATSSNWVLEHILVMEKKIGRHLIAGETVHHKNAQRADNRANNLELWSGNHPTGARAADLLSWAYEIIQLYEKTPRNTGKKTC